jgi:hypothetical protein
MNLIKKTFLVFAIATTLFSYTNIHTLTPIVIEGSVINAGNHSPVADAHAYIVLGEEEMLTSSKGEYRITSWEPLPVTLTITRKGYETIRLKINNPAEKQLIKLQQNNPD